MIAVPGLYSIFDRFCRPPDSERLFLILPMASLPLPSERLQQDTPTSFHFLDKMQHKSHEILAGAVLTAVGKGGLAVEQALPDVARIRPSP